MPKPLAPSLRFDKSLVLIGMPGAGKSSVGRKLANRLNVPFKDSDDEVERAASMRVTDIFADLGEAAFRDGERRVIARLLSGPPCVLSTGGGAFMNEATRALIKKEAISLWLKADFDVLFERVSRTNDRPLLQRGDPETILRQMMKAREPVYAEADLTFRSENLPLDETVDNVVDFLSSHFAANTV